MAVRKSLKFSQIKATVCAMVAQMESMDATFAPIKDLPTDQLDLIGAYSAAADARAEVDLDDPAHKKAKTAATKTVKDANTEFGKAKKAALLAKLEADSGIDLDGSAAKIEQAMLTNQTSYTNALVDAKGIEGESTRGARVALAKLGNLLDAASWAAFLEHLSAGTSVENVTAGKLTDNFTVKPFADSPAMVWAGSSSTLFMRHADKVYTMPLANVTSRSALNKLAWRLSGLVTNGGDVQEAATSTVKVSKLGKESIAKINCRLGVANMAVVSELPEWVPTD